MIQPNAALWAKRSRMIFRRWNWKSALLSSLSRALIFFLTNLSAGLHAATGAMIAELSYRAVTSGFYGGMTQSLSEVRPVWVGNIAALVLLPLCAHSLELAVHVMRGTPKLAYSITASVCFTALSTLFHLYAMRRGALVVRPGCGSLAQDLSRMPGLIIGFVAEGPRLLFSRLKRIGNSHECRKYARDSRAADRSLLT